MGFGMVRHGRNARIGNWRRGLLGFAADTGSPLPSPYSSASSGIKHGGTEMGVAYWVARIFQKLIFQSNRLQRVTLTGWL